MGYKLRENKILILDILYLKNIYILKRKSNYKQEDPFNYSRLETPHELY